MVSYEDGNQKLPQNKNCELALEEAVSKETFQQISMLVDDEELELRGLETVPDVPGCSGHFTTNGLRSCSLCKGWF